MKNVQTTKAAAKAPSARIEKKSLTNAELAQIAGGRHVFIGN